MRLPEVRERPSTLPSARAALRSCAPARGLLHQRRSVLRTRRRLLCLMNRARARFGLPRLRVASIQEKEHQELASRARGHAEALLDEQPWHHGGEHLETGLGARLGRDLTIVSVGEATREGDRGVRIPLVLGDGEGETGDRTITASRCGSVRSSRSSGSAPYASAPSGGYSRSGSGSMFAYGSS